MDRYEQLVRRARSLLSFVGREEALPHLREDIDDEALIFLVMAGATILMRDEP